MLPFKLVYHERYDLNLGTHVFPSQKFRLIHEMLLREKIAAPQDFLRPEVASDEDILRVHTADWVRKLKTGALTASDVMKLEVPYSPELVAAVWLAAGGSILAAQSALRDGFGSNLGGGFHHAYPGHGEGFCAIHDVAVAIRKLQADGAAKKAMVVDTDVHHGNGTAAIFRNDPAVFTISIHQENNYPAHKPPSNIDLNMEDRVDSFLCGRRGSLLRRSARRLVTHERRTEETRPRRFRGSAAAQDSSGHGSCGRVRAARGRYRAHSREYHSRCPRCRARISLRVCRAKLIVSAFPKDSCSGLPVCGERPLSAPVQRCPG